VPGLPLFPPLLAVRPHTERRVHQAALSHFTAHEALDPAALIVDLRTGSLARLQDTD
jgi:hypothetical protein